MLHESLTESILGAAINVPRALGPGLLESVDELGLCHELKCQGLGFRRQVDLPVDYKGVRLESGFRIDIIVEEVVVLELKSVDRLSALHDAQILTHLKLSGCRIGLLLNFNVPVLKDGIRRFIL